MEMTLRRATMQDAETLYDWRNDPATRAASRNTGPVAFADHKAWLEGSLSRDDRDLYVAEVEGRPVGTARVDRADGVSELSWTVAPKERGKGVAKAMVGMLAQQVPGPLRAEVRVTNLASAAIAQSIGMRLANKDFAFLYFERD